MSDTDTKRPDEPDAPRAPTAETQPDASTDAPARAEDSASDAEPASDAATDADWDAEADAEPDSVEDDRAEDETVVEVTQFPENGEETRPGATALGAAALTSHPGDSEDDDEDEDDDTALALPPEPGQAAAAGSTVGIMGDATNIDDVEQADDVDDAGDAHTSLAEALDAADETTTADATPMADAPAPSLSENPEAFWAQAFENPAPGFERNSINPAFDAWRSANAMTPPLKIIIPGCGRAPEVAELAAEPKIDVIAVDIADAAVDWQRSTLKKAGLQAQVEKADILSWRPKAPVGAVYDQTCLCALPPDQWRVYEKQLYSWLRRQGRLFILFMQTGRDDEHGPPFDCSLDRMRSLFSDDRWLWDDPPYLPSPHPMPKLHELGVVLTRR